MPYMTRMLADVKRYFPRVDVVPGWETRGDPNLTPGGVLCHWTAGPRGTGVRSSLNIVTHGRSDLSGPLCNWYLDRAGIPVAVAAGRANHGGIPDGGQWRGLRGNSSTYGIEAESGGDHDWTPAQQYAYPRLVRALLDGIGRDASWAAGHNEWAPSRKIDIRDWTMNDMRRQIAAVTLLEDDMPLTDADITKIGNHLENRLRSAEGWGGTGKRQLQDLVAAGARAGDVAVGYGQRVQNTEAMTGQVLAAVKGLNAAALADSLRPAIVAALAGAEGASAEEVATRVADTLAGRLTAGK